MITDAHIAKAIGLLNELTVGVVGQTPRCEVDPSCFPNDACIAHGASDATVDVETNQCAHARAHVLLVEMGIRRPT
jgi:hypothetical protein